MLLSLHLSITYIVASFTATRNVYHFLMVGKDHTLLCIRLGCFMLVVFFLFLSLHEIALNECVLLLLLLLLESLKCTPIQLGAFHRL